MLTTNHFEPDAEALHDVSVEQAMHVGFIGCPLETPLREVARLMSEHSRRPPAVSRAANPRSP